MVTICFRQPSFGFAMALRSLYCRNHKGHHLFTAAPKKENLLKPERSIREEPIEDALAVDTKLHWKLLKT